MYLVINIFEIILDLVLTLFAGDDWIKIRKWIEKRK